MNTSHTISFKKFALRLIAVPVAFVPLTGALADDRDAMADSDADSGPVAALKSSLRGATGFEVDELRMTEAGVACITYRVSNDNGGESRAQAVVEGDKVLRSTTGNTRFEKAWNSKCAGSSRGDS